MSEPNFLDARISRHKVESGESTPAEVPSRRRLWLKGTRFALSDDEVNGRTVVELVLPAGALAVLEDLTEAQLEALADLPIFTEAPTPNTAPLRGDLGEILAWAVQATDGTRTATLAASSTGVGMVGDGTVPTVVQSDGVVALVRAGDTRLALTGSGDVVLQRVNPEAGWETSATLTISAGELLTTANTVRWLTQAITTTLRNKFGVAMLEADAPMRIQPEQSGSGAGRELTIGGGAGQTPGTHLAGSTRVLVGTAVAGETARFGVDISPGSALFEVYQASGYNQFRLPGGGGAANCYFGIPNGGLMQIGPVAGAIAGVLANAPYIECDGQFSSAPNAVAFVAAGMTLNCALGNHHNIAALTASMSGSITLSNARAGATYTIKVVQDGSGGRTVAWNANFKFGSTYTNAAAATANHVTVWRFYAESATVWRCIGKETYTS